MYILLICILVYININVCNTDLMFQTHNTNKNSTDSLEINNDVIYHLNLFNKISLSLSKHED